jgi:hypothetical protein
LIGESDFIKASGAIPIKRAQDHPWTKVGEYNQKVFEKLLMLTQLESECGEGNREYAARGLLQVKIRKASGDNSRSIRQRI